MKSILDYMIGHHRQIDEVFAGAEEAAGKADWGRAGEGLAAFLRQMERHFEMEESVLFPKFEDRTGMIGGPTQVMRSEHDQMRGLFEDLRAAMEARDSEQFLGVSETLLVLTQQHNMKEEGILYRMMDQVFADEMEELIAEVERVPG